MNTDFEGTRPPSETLTQLHRALFERAPGLSVGYTAFTVRLKETKDPALAILKQRCFCFGEILYSSELEYHTSVVQRCVDGEAVVSYPLYMIRRAAGKSREEALLPIDDVVLFADKFHRSIPELFKYLEGKGYVPGVTLGGFAQRVAAGESSIEAFTDSNRRCRPVIYKGKVIASSFKAFARAVAPTLRLAQSQVAERFYRGRMSIAEIVSTPRQTPLPKNYESELLNTQTTANRLVALAKARGLNPVSSDTFETRMKAGSSTVDEALLAPATGSSKTTFLDRTYSSRHDAYSGACASGLTPAVSIWTWRDRVNSGWDPKVAFVTSPWTSEFWQQCRYYPSIGHYLSEARNDGLVSVSNATIYTRIADGHSLFQAMSDPPKWAPTPVDLDGRSYATLAAAYRDLQCRGAAPAVSLKTAYNRSALGYDANSLFYTAPNRKSRLTPERLQAQFPEFAASPCVLYFFRVSPTVVVGTRSPIYKLGITTRRLSSRFRLSEIEEIISEVRLTLLEAKLLEEYLLAATADLEALDFVDGGFEGKTETRFLGSDDVIAVRDFLCDVQCFDAEQHSSLFNFLWNQRRGRRATTDAV